MARKSGSNIVSIHVSIDEFSSSEVVIERTNFAITKGRPVAVKKQGDWKSRLEPLEPIEEFDVPVFGPVAEYLNTALAQDDRISGWFIVDEHTLIVQLNDLCWGLEVTEGGNVHAQRRVENADTVARWLCEVLQQAAAHSGSRRQLKFAPPAYMLFADHHRTRVDMTT